MIPIQTDKSPRCVAPDERGHLCGRPATTSRVVGGLVCALCAEHAAEVDADEETSS